MSKPQEDRMVDLPDKLIIELLTDSEIRMVKQRLLIIYLLEEGLSIRAIADQAKVGTDTVVRVIRRLEDNPSIRKFLKDHQSASSSKWIFGQVKVEE